MNDVARMARYYRILGFSAPVNFDQIKVQYRALALQYHPDRTEGDGNMMRAINEAYSYFKNLA